MTLDFGEVLYKRLPEVYRRKDKELQSPYQLQEYLNILGAGFDEFNTYVTDLINAYDVDLQPDVFLSHGIKMLGFDFPYTMTALEKRGLIKMLPLFYINKGNVRIFSYLARLIFGEDTDVLIYRGVTNLGAYTNNASYVTNSTFIVTGTTRNIEIRITLSGGIEDFDAKLAKFLILAEDFRPVNSVWLFKFTIVFERTVEFALASVDSVDDFGFCYWDLGSGETSWDTTLPDETINDAGIITLVSRETITNADITLDTTEEVVEITKTFSNLNLNGESLREYVILDNAGVPVILDNTVFPLITKTADFHLVIKARISYVLTGS